MVNAEHAWRSLSIVAIAQFMVVLDATIVFVAIPSIQADLAMSPTELQWVINAYLLPFGGFLLLGGRLADLLGRRRLFIWGAVIFTAASALNAAAPSGEVLIFSRALQGLGGALISPAALSIVASMFAERPDRTKAMSVWAVIAGGGGAVGLVVGGMLTQWFAWEWIFLLNLPLGALAAVAGWRYLPAMRPAERSGSFDIGGAVSGTAGLVLLAYAIVQTDEHAWASARTIGLMLAAFAVLAAFFAIETRGRDPLVPMGIFKVRALTTANGVCALCMGSVMPVFLFITIYLQEILGFDPIQAGLGFLPYMLFVLAGSALAARMMRTAGLQRVLPAGIALAVPGFLLLTRLDPEGSYLSGVFPAMCILGAGMGLVLVPVTLAATASVDASDSGLASGLYNTSLQLGGALGIAILSTVAQHATGEAVPPAPSALVDGYHVAFAVAALAMTAGAAAVWTTLRAEDVEGIAVDDPGILVV